MPAVAWRADGRDGCGQPRHTMPSDTIATLMDALMTGVILSALWGGREAGRVALSARGVEGGDADGPPEGDGIADEGAAHGGLTAIGRVAQHEPGQLHAAVHHPALGLQTRGGDPVVDARDLPIEPGQLALAEHVDEARPGLAVEGVGPCGVALPGPVRVGPPPRPAGANHPGSRHYPSRPPGPNRPDHRVP